MVDALHVEHSFAHALGIGEGQRNDVNDADYVRSGKLAHLARALKKALPRLKKRAQFLQDSSQMKAWIEFSIGDLEAVQNSVDKLDEMGQISQPACWELWSLSAVSIRLIDTYLTERGC